MHNGCSKIYSVLRDSKLRMHKARTRGSERSQANLKKHFRFALAWHQLESQFALLSTRLDSLDSVNTKRTVNLKHWHKIVRIIPAWGRAKIPWFIVKSDPLLQGYRAVRLILYPPISVEYIYLFIYLFIYFFYFLWRRHRTNFQLSTMLHFWNFLKIYISLHIHHKI